MSQVNIQNAYQQYNTPAINNCNWKLGKKKNKAHWVSKTKWKNVLKDKLNQICVKPMCWKPQNIAERNEGYK